MRARLPAFLRPGPRPRRAARLRLGVVPEPPRRPAGRRRAERGGGPRDRAGAQRALRDRDERGSPARARVVRAVRAAADHAGGRPEAPFRAALRLPGRAGLARDQRSRRARELVPVRRLDRGARERPADEARHVVLGRDAAVRAAARRRRLRAGLHARVRRPRRGRQDGGGLGPVLHPHGRAAGRRVIGRGGVAGAVARRARALRGELRRWIPRSAARPSGSIR